MSRAGPFDDQGQVLCDACLGPAIACVSGTSATRGRVFHKCQNKPLVRCQTFFRWQDLDLVQSHGPSDISTGWISISSTGSTFSESESQEQPSQPSARDVPDVGRVVCTECNGPSLALVSMMPPSKGRVFYKCQDKPSPRCVRFFQWQEDAYVTI